MKLIQAVLALLLCLYVWQAWRQGLDTFPVIADLTVPFWLIIPVAVICAAGAVADLLRRPSGN